MDKIKTNAIVRVEDDDTSLYEVCNKSNYGDGYYILRELGSNNRTKHHESTIHYVCMNKDGNTCISDIPKIQTDSFLCGDPTDLIVQLLLAYCSYDTSSMNDSAIGLEGEKRMLEGIIAMILNNVGNTMSGIISEVADAINSIEKRKASVGLI